jgi:peptidoglycan/LPS O-acetylase OafA/YrhL
MTELPVETPVVLRAPRRLYLILLAVSTVLIGLAYALGDLDMAKGALLGSVLVGMNLMGTVAFIRMVLRDRRYKALLFASFISKFGLTMVVLYIAILRLDMSALGILIGLSSMLLASLIYAALRPEAREGSQKLKGEKLERQPHGTGSP